MVQCLQKALWLNFTFPDHYHLKLYWTAQRLGEPRPFSVRKSPAYSLQYWTQMSWCALRWKFV